MCDQIPRPTFPQIFAEMARLVAERSTCLRRQVGAVLVKDNMVLATGYNGAPRNVKHCETCIREEMGVPSGERHEVCRGIHAEQNCIIQCARLGLSCVGATLYCTHQPCNICYKILHNAGIARIEYNEAYPQIGYEED